jgi:hypothetical protein
MIGNAPDFLDPDRPDTVDFARVLGFGLLQSRPFWIPKRDAS